MNAELLNKCVQIKVTGRYYNSKKYFESKIFHNDIAGRISAFGINLWRGSIWGILPNGKCKLIKRVWN